MNEKMPEGLRWSIGWIFYTCIQPYILLTIADLELIREQNISIFKLMPGYYTFSSMFYANGNLPSLPSTYYVFQILK